MYMVELWIMLGPEASCTVPVATGLPGGDDARVRSPLWGYPQLPATLRSTFMLHLGGKLARP